MALMDAYELRARLTPGLLAIAPVTFLVSTLGLKRFPPVAIGAGVLTTAGGTYLLSLLVAHYGRAAQEHLWREWSGRPTTQLLRTQGAPSSRVQRDIWRTAISDLTGVALLSPRREAANPEAADAAIEAAVDQVRYLGQDARFPMVASENAQYGLERNMYGFRWIGRGISLLCTLGLLATWLLVRGQRHPPFSLGALMTGFVIDALFFLGWLALPSAKRAEAAGHRYANQLFQAVVNLNRSTNASQKPAQGGSNADS
jgi:hypothetical protein